MQEAKQADQEWVYLGSNEVEAIEESVSDDERVTLPCPPRVSSAVAGRVRSGRPEQSGLFRKERAAVLPPNHYRANVCGVALPRFADLNGRLFDSASWLFAHRGWMLIPMPGDPDGLTGRKVFWVCPCDRDLSMDQLTDAAFRFGYRPATHHEAFDFSCAHPDLQRSVRIVAGGSQVRCGNETYLAMLAGDAKTRTFMTVRRGRTFRGYAFLFVRVRIVSRSQRT